MNVKQAVVPLCIFGFLQEFFSWEKILSTHITYFMADINETPKDMKATYSFFKYSDLVAIIPILLLTDLLRYKTVLILKAVLAVGLFCLFQWTTSVGAARFAIVVYGFYYCCEVAYISYMFDHVTSEHFMTVSSLTRSTLIAGHAINALFFNTFLKNIEYDTYKYCALASQIAALLIAAILLKFNRTHSSSSSVQTQNNMITQLQTAMSNQHVVFYSIWYIVGFGLFYQFIIAAENSIQFFHFLQNEFSWHGFFIAIVLALSACFVELTPRMTFITRDKQSNLIFLAAVSLSSSAIIFLANNVETRFVMYLCFGASCILYYTTITISSAEIAKGILPGSYGLIFGLNTFLGLCLRVIISEIVEGLELKPNSIFTGYGTIMALAGFTYILFMLMCNVRTSKPGVVFSRNTGSNI